MNSKLLVSSHLFLLNSVYACIINEISTAAILFMVYVLSTLHHFTNTPNSIYHYADCFMSRFATLWIFVNNLKYTHVYYCIMALNNVILSYSVARCVYLIYGDSRWIWFHMYFHVLTNFIIYVGLVDCNSSNNLLKDMN